MDNEEYNNYIKNFYNIFNDHVNNILKTPRTRLPQIIDMIYKEIKENEKGKMNIGNVNIDKLVTALNGYVNHIFEFEDKLLITDMRDGRKIDSLELHNVLKSPNYAKKITKILISKIISQRIHIFLVAYATIYNYELIEDCVIQNGRIEYNCDTRANNSGGIYYGYILDKIAHFAFEEGKMKYEHGSTYNRDVSLCKRFKTNEIKIDYCERHSMIRDNYRTKVNFVVKIVLTDNQIKEINNFFKDNMDDRTIYFYPKMVTYWPRCIGTYDNTLDHHFFTNSRIFLDSKKNNKDYENIPYQYKKICYDSRAADKYHKDDYIPVYPYDYDFDYNYVNFYVKNRNTRNTKTGSVFINMITRYHKNVQTTLIDVLEDTRIILTESMMVFIARYFDYYSFIRTIRYGGVITTKVLESACYISMGCASPNDKYKIIDLCSRQVKPTKTAFRNIIKSRYNYKFTNSSRKYLPCHADLSPVFPQLHECFTEMPFISLFDSNDCRHSQLYGILDYLVHDNNYRYVKLSKKYRKYQRGSHDIATYSYYYALNEAIYILVKNGFKIEAEDLVFAYKNSVIISPTFIDGIYINKYYLEQIYEIKSELYDKNICVMYYDDLIKNGTIKINNNNNDTKKQTQINASDLSEKYYKVNNPITDHNMNENIIERLNGNIFDLIKDDIKVMLQIENNHITYIEFRKIMMEYLSKNKFITKDGIKLISPFKYNKKTTIMTADINNWVISLLNIHKLHIRVTNTNVNTPKTN